jgi:hypothetical protein
MPAGALIRRWKPAADRVPANDENICCEEAGYSANRLFSAGVFCLAQKNGYSGLFAIPQVFMLLPEKCCDRKTKGSP